VGCAETSDEYGTHLMMEIVAAFNAVSYNFTTPAKADIKLAPFSKIIKHI